MTDEEVQGLAECIGWDIQHYKASPLIERSHLVALLLHVRNGADSAGYTADQANAVLQRLFRSAPTVLSTVDEILSGAEPPYDATCEDTTAARRASAADGVRAAKKMYGADYRDVPWPSVRSAAT